jgi:hypothetical protein
MTMPRQEPVLVHYSLANEWQEQEDMTHLTYLYKHHSYEPVHRYRVIYRFREQLK